MEKELIVNLEFLLKRNACHPAKDAFFDIFGHQDVPLHEVLRKVREFEEENWEAWLLSQPEFCESLIDMCVNVNIDVGWALANAVDNDWTEVIVILAENGIDLDANDGYALRESIDQEDSKKVEILAKYGADLEISDGYALDNAVYNEDSATVEVLAKYGVNLEANGGEALSSAVDNNDAATVKILARYGVDLDAYEGNALKVSAIFEEALEMVELLIQEGAPVREELLHEAVHEEVDVRIIETLKKALKSSKSKGSAGTSV